MKKRVLAGVLAIAMAAMAGVSTSVSAQEGRKTWAVAVHFLYADGFSFDYILGTGLSNAEKTAMLAWCGQSHWTGSVVRYHCYPIPE